MNKKSKFIKLPKWSLEFLKKWRKCKSYNDVLPQWKGIITITINHKGCLNSKHLKIINQALKKHKSISNILDKSNIILQSKSTENVTSQKKKSNIPPKPKPIILNPFDVHWKPKKGKTPKQNHDLYMRSNIWKRKRNFILSKRGYKCQNPQCNQPLIPKSKLHCHHLTYKRFGCENENDLQILCESCHDKIHRENTIYEIESKFERNIYINGVEIKNHYHQNK